MIHIKDIAERPSKADIEALSKFSPATIHEAQGRRGALSSRIKPVDYRMKLCGPAFTVKCAPRDNIMLQLAINYAKPGDIIVVSAGEYEEAGSFGDVLANACLAKGIGGLVTDTGVRDTLQLRDLGFPVFSFSVCIKGTVKETIAAVNDTIIIGDEIVNPGDIIVGDADGLVVVRRADAQESARLSQIREDAEAGFIEAYKQGKSVIEVSNLEPVLKAKGLVVDI
ncbi:MULTISPECIES: 4-carboxy-4-hydroxy-2-oxoadipate aldolase/oxaloacetate decarboxylase [Rhizobium/Agrobacterium group]|jgi:4-hydroxy-4-methyl-2-oxoglutarate aldolase|uniref:RraA family protein n=2 Tax=Rhizobium/Agrobacterium group TaxID=227290 RepID=A0A1B9UFR8_AGRTU|nr:MULTISPECIES: 4-carboxy-4-hydroxy-2-oxoadipate aldolase/oxaloacetate decarboxylase [Rhizobium/Agrobacterium group]AHK03740.1 demethylmenaquinone methyltransferase [Agrobacterium tumefaciens LBA4213 (Ach5)]AKC09501.1 S-adenosylmethionine:2-demethylmenaquinone methyltransferase [Agrobacterium tumefaciens]EHJ95865.1 S-adenosylmethionine:2-demethylmenaquinonemethyltransferase [Agrobacterium tumefaciens 5A]MDP9562938.1 4-hydroxy-4-methyl-2-oxoglutarate aldolase [Rhizobium nepotum]HCV70626.1 RraA